MKILAVDVGTGTQDILLFDSEREVENCLKMILPSPTLIIARGIQQATKEKKGLVLSGVTMGGGPCSWAAEDHLKAGLPLMMTPNAARTFNDDLEKIEAMGIKIIGDEEAKKPTREFVHLQMKDFDYPAIRNAFAGFGIDLNTELAAIALAVFDHGQAPPGVSDRLFRFEYLTQRLHRSFGLKDFAFLTADVPRAMTRLKAAAQTAQASIPVPIILMDTAPAAVLGALEDPVVSSRETAIIVNIGNFHTLAFRLRNRRVEGLFEHHTGEITPSQLENFIIRLGVGRLTNNEIYDSKGHGAILFEHSAFPSAFVVVIGPRRNMFKISRLDPYFAAPFGDMMLTGCYGLIRVCADLLPVYKNDIERGLAGGSGRSLW